MTILKNSKDSVIKVYLEDWKHGRIYTLIKRDAVIFVTLKVTQSQVLHIIIMLQGHEDD